MSYPTKTLEQLQRQLAICHARLVLGPGYELLEKYDPLTYRRLHAIALACTKVLNARGEKKARRRKAGR